MKKTSTCVATIVTALLLGTLALIVPAPAEAATPAPGSDCGCTSTTGAYKAPGAPVEPNVEPDGSSAPTAPKYRVETTGGWPDVTVKVRRLADSQVVLTVFGAPTNWGFSPDQDRFVTYGIHNTVFSVHLYDLTATNPSNTLWTGSTVSSESRVAFSPHGRYLAFTQITSVARDQVLHQLVHTTTGSEYAVQYSFYVPPGGTTRPFGEAGFGFSPDGGDRALFTSVVTGQMSVQNSLWDLRAKSQTWSALFGGSSGFWRFSPCGDMLGLVEQGETGDHVSLIRVTDGQQVASQTHPFPISTIGFTATATQHQVVVNNVAHFLANNTAGAACADTTAPTWPANPTLVAGNVTKTSLTLTWPAATDDKAVVQYRVYKGSTLLGTTGGTGRTYNVTGLTQGTSYTFRVQAADAAGNATTDGPSVTVRTAADAPAWPAGSSVAAADVTETGATLRWSAAAGTVSSYKVYRDGVAVGTLPGTTRTYAATGLSEATSYVFKIEAVGPTGAESVTGPGTRVRTPGFQQLDEPTVAGTLWWDDNGDGVRDQNEEPVDGKGYPHVGVYLYRMVEGNAAVGPMAASIGEDGTYRLANLEDGDYLVSTIVAPWVQSFPADYQPQRMTVAGGHGVGGVDFGLKSSGSFPEQGTGTGAITATVTGAEAGVDCYFVSLGSGCGIDPTAGENGNLTFDGLTPGTYALAADLGPNQWQTSPVLNGEPLKRIVVIGSNAAGGSAAFTVDQGRSRITGTVYDDANGDGVRNEGEGPLNAPDYVDVCVESGDGSDRQCTSTDGAYAFENLRDGDYRITADESGSWARTQPADGPVLVHVAANGDTVEADLLGVHYARGSVHGLVWEDLDADGERDGGEPGVPGISVCVQKNGADGWNCQDTDAEGGYATGLLPVADYTVWIEDGFRDAWTQTFPAEHAQHDVSVTDRTEHVADFGLNDGTVVPEETAPGAPRALEAVPGVEQVTLTWTAPASDGGSPVTSYVVEQSLDGVVWSQAGATTETSLEVTGLAGGIPVRFRVAAVNAVGRGAWSDPAMATPEQRIVAPSAPSGLHATAGVEKVTLDWSAPDSDGGSPVTSYVVEQSLDGVAWTEAGTPSGTTLEVTGLTAGTPVRFRVAAVNVAGRGGYSGEATATPLPRPAPEVTVPGAPTGLAASVSKNRRTVLLTWKAPASDGNAPITDYVIQRTLFPSLGWVTVADGVSPATSATLGTAVPGLRTYYRVAARNSAGLGAWSAAVQAG